MTAFFVGDVVTVEMPRGYSNRGVLGISLLYTTSPEARFDGATGTVAEINPVGPYSSPQYLVDFRTRDNSRAGLPWQAHWFREEWLALVERAAVGVDSAVCVGAAVGAGVGAGAGVRAEAAAQGSAMVGGGGSPGVSRGASGTGPSDIDPHATQVGGFSWGEDSELAQQDLPASAPPVGRTTQGPEDGGYFGTPAVAQPVRDHAGEERGDGVVGPDATGTPASTARGADATTAEHPRDGGTARLDEATLADASGRSTGSVSGAATTAPSSPLGETDLRTTPTGLDEAAANTAERYEAGIAPPGDRDPAEETHQLSRSGTSLLDPSRVSGFEEDLAGGAPDASSGGGVAKKGDGARSVNQG